MLVRERMQSPVFTIDVGASLREALDLTLAHKFRHLPVLEGGRLVGVVTDRDLRRVTSSLYPDPRGVDEPVRTAMSAPPYTADPLDPVEDAAWIMREHRIGCLPVVDGPDLVGMLTVIDILEAVILLTGVGQASSRLEVVLSDRPGELARLTAFLAARNLNIHSILTYPDQDQNVRTVLRVGTNQMRPLTEALRRDGFQILWPPPSPWQH